MPHIQCLQAPNMAFLQCQVSSLSAAVNMKGGRRSDMLLDTSTQRHITSVLTSQGPPLSKNLTSVFVPLQWGTKQTRQGKKSGKWNIDQMCVDYYYDFFNHVMTKFIVLQFKLCQQQWRDRSLFCAVRGNISPSKISSIFSTWETPDPLGIRVL